MAHSREFIAGYRHAIEDLGREGDECGADWSNPYKFLLSRLTTLGPPNDPEQFQGIRIVADPSVAAGIIEFHHTDGRVDYFKA